MKKSVILILLLVLVIGCVQQETAVDDSLQEVIVEDSPHEIAEPQEAEELPEELPVINKSVEESSPPKDLGLDSVAFVLPVRKEDVVFEGMGIWPFGVPGGDHPHGHPGIDFDLKEGAPVLAVMDGRINNIGDSGHYGFKTLTLSQGRNFDVYYTGALKDFTVENRDQVKAGDIIAYSGLYEDMSTGGFHLGVQDWKKNLSVCPAEYFAEEAMKDMEALFAQAEYQEQNEYPLLCNPCPEGGCY